MNATPLEISVKKAGKADRDPRAPVHATGGWEEMNTETVVSGGIAG